MHISVQHITKKYKAGKKALDHIEQTACILYTIRK